MSWFTASLNKTLNTITTYKQTTRPKFDLHIISKYSGNSLLCNIKLKLYNIVVPKIKTLKSDKDKNIFIFLIIVFNDFKPCFFFQKR